MSKSLPAPLLPADVDLRNMDYMPVYIERLRRSRAMVLAASEPAAGFSMRLLWEESWWSLPAASLEDDELLLASAARCSRAEWKQRRPIALYGWILCSDGRLYHPVICEIAWATWQERLKHRHKNACDRMAKANKKAIDDSNKDGKRRHVTLTPIPSFEGWVTSEYPATAAKLFAAAATPAVPAPASRMPAEAENSPRPLGVVEQKPPEFSAKGGGILADQALKREGEDKISPPTPPCGEAATGQETGEENQRPADFAAFMHAVGQPDAPTATCWRAWLGVVESLPERRVLLAQVAAWRRHCAKEAQGKPRYRPLGPARLLREGTLANFAEAAAALLADETAAAVISIAESERDERVREIWGDLFPRMVLIMGGEQKFLSWFAEAWPERVGGGLVIWTRKIFVRDWVKDHYLLQISRGLGCDVDIKQGFEQRGAA